MPNKIMWIYRIFFRLAIMLHKHINQFFQLANTVYCAELDRLIGDNNMIDWEWKQNGRIKGKKFINQN